MTLFRSKRISKKTSETTFLPFNPLLFCLLPAQASSFLIHPFPNRVNCDIFGDIPLTVQHLYDLQNTMSFSCHAMLFYKLPPTQPLHKKSDDFPWSGKQFKYIPLHTYLICFSPKGFNC